MARTIEINDEQQRGVTLNRYRYRMGEVNVAYRVLMDTSNILLILLGIVETM